MTDFMFFLKIYFLPKDILNFDLLFFQRTEEIGKKFDCEDAKTFILCYHPLLFLILSIYYKQDILLKIYIVSFQ